MMLGIVLTLLLSDPTLDARKPPKPCEVILSVTPPLAVSVGGSAQVRVDIRIPIAEERCYCPDVRVRLYAGGLPVDSSLSSTSERQSDCDPWREHPAIVKGEFVAATERSWRADLGSGGVYRLEQGTWTFEARLTQGAWVRVVTRTVEVLG